MDFSVLIRIRFTYVVWCGQILLVVCIRLEGDFLDISFKCDCICIAKEQPLSYAGGQQASINHVHETSCSYTSAG